MSCEYVDVVTVSTPCNGKKLRIAPFSCGLKVGDRVMIEVDYNPWEIQGTVEDIATFNTNREEYHLLRSFVGIGDHGTHDLDMRVTKKLEYFTLWDEGDE